MTGGVRNRAYLGWGIQNRPENGKLNNVSSIYGLVFVGWVERSSKVCLYFSNRTLLFSRRVLKICQVKPNALRRQEHWLVGFRYIYLLERFVADESCV